MTEQARKSERARPLRLEMITIYRDRQDMPYDQALVRLQERAEIYTVFSIVGTVRDVSDRGFGFSFEGQQIMSENLLEPYQHYLLKLALMPDELPDELRSIAHREENYCHLVVKGRCQWYRRGPKSAAAGFSVSPDNPAEVLRFLQQHFHLD